MPAGVLALCALTQLLLPGLPPCLPLQHSRYDPVRSVLAATPASGVPRYDFARSLVSPACCSKASCWLPG